MFLKNYTSNVPVSQTIYRIEQVLIKCGGKRTFYQALKESNFSGMLPEKCE